MAEILFPLANSLRILSIDGGGIKGYTALLILRRIIRTIATEGNLASEPRPCDIFDLIAGTSTGGLIAVMLGRLHMTVDECISAYETVGKEVFGHGIAQSRAGKVIKALISSPFYDIDVMQKQIQNLLEETCAKRSSFSRGAAKLQGHAMRDSKVY